MSFPPYPEYRNTGVEWLPQVPSHWEVKRLKYTVQLITAKTDRRENPIALENIEGWTGRSIETGSDFEGEGVAFSSGDILFGKLRPYLAKVYLADAHGEAIGDFHVLRPLAGIEGRFAQYYLLTREFIDVVNGGTFGSKMPRASWNYMGGLSIAYPATEEQLSIVKFLESEIAKIDGLVADQHRLIELLNEKRQVIISQAVAKGLNPHAPMKSSGVEWLDQIPAHWTSMSLAKSSVKITNGYVGPTRDILVATGTPYIQATHIKGGRINFDQQYFVTPEWSKAHAKSILAEEDVLVVQTGAGTGDVGLVSKIDAGFNCHALIIITPDKSLLRGGFLSAFLQSTYGQQKLTSIQTGAMHPHLNCSDVKFVEVPLPPLDEQAFIVAHISQVSEQFDRLTSDARSAIELLQDRRSALISAAVIGQIDVRAVTELQPA